MSNEEKQSWLSLPLFLVPTPVRAVAASWPGGWGHGVGGQYVHGCPHVSPGSLPPLSGGGWEGSGRWEPVRILWKVFQGLRAWDLPLSAAGETPVPACGLKVSAGVQQPKALLLLGLLSPHLPVPTGSQPGSAGCPPRFPGIPGVRVNVQIRNADPAALAPLSLPSLPLFLSVSSISVSGPGVDTCWWITGFLAAFIECISHRPSKPVACLRVGVGENTAGKGLCPSLCVLDSAVVRALSFHRVPVR